MDNDNRDRQCNENSPDEKAISAEHSKDVVQSVRAVPANFVSKVNFPNIHVTIECNGFVMRGGGGEAA